MQSRSSSIFSSNVTDAVIIEVMALQTALIKNPVTRKRLDPHADPA